MARPRIDFNWDVVDALCSMKASERYVAEYLLKKDGVSPHEIDDRQIAKKIKLLQNRIKERWGISFVQFREQKNEDWKIKLTQLQRKSAENGNITMQIWLGKQDLGQSDKMIKTIEPPRPPETEEERIARKARIEEKLEKIQLLKNGT